MISDLSVVIPAYNEESRIGATIAALRPYLQRNAENYEVLFVDDGSKDATVQVVGGLIADWPEARLLTLSRNRGKGFAIREGVLAAAKSHLCFMDADCSTDLEMLPRLYAQLSPTRPIVIGSRDARGAEITVHQSWAREYSAKLFNLWIQLLLLPGVWDTQCGFKLFETSVARTLFRDLNEHRFGFDIETLYRAKLLGLPIVEVPVRWSNVLNSRVNPVRDGLAMAWQVVKLRLTTTIGKRASRRPSS